MLELIGTTLHGEYWKLPSEPYYESPVEFWVTDEFGRHGPAVITHFPLALRSGLRPPP